ncbi:MAG: hypothetical protein LBQ66_10915 [Planctomycetaceae bacterium]|nr:hypothetical protein [Planctomycetaceae bacterium]
MPAFQSVSASRRTYSGITRAEHPRSSPFQLRGELVWYITRYIPPYHTFKVTVKY